MEKKILEKLYARVSERKEDFREGSYTCRLFRAGKDEILKKLGEESVECIIAAMGEPRERVISEVADLIFHLLVFMVEEQITLADVYEELERRSRDEPQGRGTYRQRTARRGRDVG
ncbi:MAG: phosphoribosyl-ATP diphosphatase [Thermodesulfovibrionales bacterium]